MRGVEIAIAMTAMQSTHYFRCALVAKTRPRARWGLGCVCNLFAQWRKINKISVRCDDVRAQRDEKIPLLASVCKDGHTLDNTAKAQNQYELRRLLLYLFLLLTSVRYSGYIRGAQMPFACLL